MGYLNKHSDPVNGHQLALPLMVLSSKGRDFQEGGVYLEYDGKKYFYEDECDVGDVIITNAQLPHGVELIDPNFKKGLVKI